MDDLRVKTARHSVQDVLHSSVGDYVLASEPLNKPFGLVDCMPAVGAGCQHQEAEGAGQEQCREGFQRQGSSGCPAPGIISESCHQRPQPESGQPHPPEQSAQGGEGACSGWRDLAVSAAQHMWRLQPTEVYSVGVSERASTKGHSLVTSLHKAMYQ